uniref:Uncharacterized protein n=1 Tax=Arundo donax TaxID=35708 RepID=A0A0A8XZL9_ARUDO
MSLCFRPTHLVIVLCQRLKATQTCSKSRLIFSGSPCI